MLPTRPASSWHQSLDLPSRLFPMGFGWNDDDGVELYEEDEEFVLTCDMPGFAREEITVSWDDGTLYISGEHEDEERGRKRTHHRTFRMPKEIEPDDISARYRNGMLEVRLPILSGAADKGHRIELED